MFGEWAASETNDLNGAENAARILPINAPKGLCVRCLLAVGRSLGDGRTIFKSVGTALEDLAAAVLVFQSTTSY